ncbi:hypothetical protein JEQ12_013060 [Ovis aries]|uniref:Uncharacterized protein n=1 Tax=Ovis aries TaxID=9940 RepID=A0A836CRD3_SHEEP|nr:hypothetical protein JEQ12_013060 [Ovis aries]
MWGSLTPEAPHKLPILTLQAEQQRADTSRVSLSLSTPEGLPVVTLDSHISIIQEMKTEQNRQTVASALVETQSLRVRLAFQDTPAAMPSPYEHAGSSPMHLWV